MLNKCHIGIYALLLLMSPLVQSTTDCNNADIPKEECDALVTLYHSTDGPNWADNDGWLETNKVCDKFRGVKCANGHVISLFLSSNLLAGEIPSELSNLTKLQGIELSKNSLTGEIPSELGSFTDMDEFFMHSNKLCGEIPVELQNLADPKSNPFFRIRLENNHLTASDPKLIAWLDHYNPRWKETQTECPGICAEVTQIPLNECQALLTLYNSTTGDDWNTNTDWLETNKPCDWYGVTCRYGHVRTLTLGENNLDGFIPAELSELVELRKLSLYGNELCGDIPPELTSLININVLNLNDNHLNTDVTDTDLKAWLDDHDSRWTEQTPCINSGTLQFSEAMYDVDENGGIVKTIMVSRVDGSEGEATVNCVSSDGTATVGVDYAEVSETLNWADGDTNDQTCVVNIINDGNFEGDETFNLTLEDVMGATIGTPDTAEITILEDEPSPPVGTLQFSEATYSVNENNGIVTITVTRVGGSYGAVSVDYKTSNGSATDVDDYIATNDTLNWGDGNTDDQTFTVDITDDTVFEIEETFNLTLENPTGGAELGEPIAAVVTITDDDPPPPGGILQFSSATYEVNEDGVSIIITVKRIGGSDGAASVDYATRNGTATEPDDYERDKGVLRWNDGDDTDRTFEVFIIDDNESEGDETIKLKLRNPEGAIFGDPKAAIVTIVDNEIPGVLQFTSDKYEVDEGDGRTEIVKVSRTEGSFGTISVNYESSDGTAIVWEDYKEATGTLEWSDGDVADKTLKVRIKEDSDVEDDETFSLTLIEPTGGGAVIGDLNTTEVTITDNEVTGDLKFSSATYSVGEGDGTVEIKVSRVGGSDGVITVDYATLDDTATNGDDYTTTNGTLEWVAGDDTEKTITVPIIDNFIVESDETFSLTLVNATGGAKIIAPDTTVVTIVDNEVPGTLQFTSATYSVNENEGSITIMVSRVDGNDGDVSVEYASSEDTAKAGDDYTTVSGKLDWSAGDASNKTFTVPIIDNTLVESDETFNLALAKPTGGAELGDPITAVVTIVDEEVPGVLQFSKAKYKINEAGGAITTTVKRIGGSDGAVSVDCVSSNGTAKAEKDYIAVSETLNWADSDVSDKSCTVTILDDSLLEGKETFDLKLENETGGASVGDPNTATVTIVDNDEPGILQFTKATYQVNEAGGVVTIIVSRIGGSDGSASVKYASSDDTATAGEDYTEVKKGKLDWEDGDASNKSFTVAITDDSNLESDETFKLNLKNATGAKLGEPNEAVVTIIDNEVPNPGTLQFESATYDVDETGKKVKITVTRIGGTYGAVSVDYATSNGTATAGEDYVEATETLKWKNGDNKPKKITVKITDDGNWEGNETFNMTLTNATGEATIGDPDTAVVTITDDETPPESILQFSSATYSVDENGGSVEITVTRIEGSHGAISVQYASSDDTATVGEDYVEAKGELSWEDGDASDKTFTVNITDDTVLEGDETFNLSLKKPKGATIGDPGKAVVTIVDDDVPGILQFSEAKYKVNEAGGSVTITVSRIGGSDGAVSVKYASSDESAKAGKDYTEATGELNWADGDTSDQTFKVEIIDDTKSEENETFKVTLSEPTGGAEIGELGETVVTIVDRDAPGILQFSKANYKVNEASGSVTAIVSRIDGNDGAVSVDCVSSDGTAKADEDYTAVSETLNWGDSDVSDKTCTVAINDDTDSEGNETFNLSLKKPKGATIGVPGEAVVTIIDGDEPGILRFSKAKYEVNEAGGSVIITVSRVSGSDGAISVKYASLDDTATAGEDYIEATGTLNWNDGDASNKTFTVDINDDNIAEGDETFKLNLKKATGGATIGDPKEVIVTIVDDEVLSTLQFTLATYSVSEAGGAIEITVSRVDGSDGAVSVKYASDDDTATAEEDYTAVSGKLEWSNGDADDKTFIVTILEDAIFEGDETFNLSLKNATGAIIGAQGTAIVTIVDNEVPGTLQFSSAMYDVDEDGGSVEITVSRIDGSDGKVSVQYTSKDGTATAGEDYTQIKKGKLSWEDGDASDKTFTVDIINDEILEDNEIFNLSLKKATGGAEIGDQGTAEVTIVDDDRKSGTLQFSSATYSVDEAGGSIKIIVTRVGGSDGKVSVDYASSDGTATAGEDYAEITGTLEWKNGDKKKKTFTVAIANDGDFEGDETFIVSLGNPTNGAELGTPDTAVVTIIDNDEPSVCLDVTQIPTYECEALVALYKSTDGANWTVKTNWNVTNTPCSWHGVACSVGHVSRLSLYSNNLNGKIPAKLGDLTKLRRLFLFDNALSGNIPAEFGNFSRLQYLWLHDNELCGKIPDGLMNTSIPAQEGYLKLEDNHLGSSVSDALKIWLDVRNPSWEEQNSDVCPGTLQFSSATYSVNEDDGTTKTINVERINGRSGEVSVVCSTSDDTATAGDDYTETTKTLIWNDGESADKECKIKITDDGSPEDEETFIVSLGEPDGANLGAPDTAVVTINDND